MANTDRKRIDAREPVLPRRRRVTLGAVALAAASLLPAFPAFAHHGWPGFDTDHLMYVAGTVSSEGVWGNPHSLFDVTLDSNLSRPHAYPKDPNGVAGSRGQ